MGQEVVEKMNNKKQYLILAMSLGRSVGGEMYRAMHYHPMSEEITEVAVKIFTINLLDPAAYNSVLHDVYKARIICDHENIVSVDFSFMSGNNELYAIMPALPGHPIRSAIDHCADSPFRHGLPANSVTFLLKQTLNALHHMHCNNVLHGMIGADCIFIDDQTTLKVAFPSLSYFRSRDVKERVLCSTSCCCKCECTMYADADVELPEPRFPVWATAPELLGGESNKKNKTKATDIWMFGLLAVELFYGKRCPASDMEELESILLIGNDDEKTKKKKNTTRWCRRVLSSCLRRSSMPEALREVVAACLSKDPNKRPTTSQLMDYNLFKMFTPTKLDTIIITKLKEACMIDLTLSNCTNSYLRLIRQGIITRAVPLSMGVLIDKVAMS